MKGNIDYEAEHEKAERAVISITRSCRHRINFSMTSKGFVTTDITFEAVGFTKEEAVKEAGLLLEIARQVAKKQSEVL